MPESATICTNCHISNPAGSKKCVKCGEPLAIVEQPRIKEPWSRPRKLSTNPAPARVYYPYPQPPPEGILPGRPPWIVIYALFLGVTAAACLGAIGFRILSGTTGTIYSNFLVAILIVAGSTAALPASSALWQMRQSGLRLTLFVQVVWIMVAVILVYHTFVRLPTNWRNKFFDLPTSQTLQSAGIIALAILLILFAPIWMPAIFGVIRVRGGYSDRFAGIFVVVLGAAFICGFLLMFIAVPIMIFDPALFEKIDPQSPVPGLLRLGFTASIPINLLVVGGLLLERSRFR